MTLSRWLLLAAALCAGGAGFFLARQIDSTGPQLASGTWFPQAREVPAFTLTAHNGAPFTRADLTGAPALVFFGFTHCPDVCPTTLVKLAAVRRAAAVPGLRVILVTVDPQRDTPAALAAYVHAFDADFIGLTGPPSQLEALARYFGVVTSRVDLPGGDYTMDHSAVVFVLDARAREVALFTPPFNIQAMTSDLKRAAPYLRAGS